MFSNKNLRKNNKGITLVALVITIIVLILLANLTYNIAIGNLGQAEKSKQLANKGSADEDINLAIIYSKVNKDRKIDKNLLREALGNLGIQDSDIQEESGRWIVQYKGYEYIIEIGETGVQINIALFDYINEKDLGTIQATLAATAELNDTNISIPAGYELYSKRNSSIKNPTATIENGKADKESYTVNVYKKSEQGEILIENVTGLKKINSNMAERYALDSDINLSTESNWAPIGQTTSTVVDFTGEFNGNNHTISNMTCNYANTKNNVGLIASNLGTIKNLNVINSTTIGSSAVGTICGTNGEGGTVSSCHVKGNVTSNSTNTSTGGAGGGVVGSNSGTVEYCSIEGAIQGYMWTGGVVGKNFGTTRFSYFIGGVNSSRTDSQILANTNLHRYIGGIVGGNTGTIENSYSILTNYVKGYAGIGGIAGWNSGGTLRNLYVAGYGMAYGAQYVEPDVGYISVMPSYSGLYTYKTTATGLTALPSSLESQYWNMSGSTYASCPNLIQNAR